MPARRLIRPSHAQHFGVVLVSFLMFSGFALAESGSGVAPGGRPAVADPVRRALREFDRFLDHHPLMEDDLRLNPSQRTDRGFLERNPGLRQFFDANPDVLKGLKAYPRYFVYRALIREANVPLRFAQIARLGEVLDERSGLEKVLARNPESIRDPAFLAGHERLRDFLIRHPDLGRVFLSPNENSEKPS